jgi:hypothetical protein
MKPKLSKTENLVRRIGSVAVAAGVALFIGLYMIPKAMVDFSIAMPVMVAVSAIGAAIFYLTIKRTSTAFWISQGIFACSMVIAGFAAVHYLKDNNQNLLTCPVCGYKSLTVAEAQCMVCGVRVSMAEASSNGYPDVDSYVMEQQMLFFAPDSGQQPINFLNGASPDSPYLKDNDWHPMVTESDVRSMIQMRDSMRAHPTGH